MFHKKYDHNEKKNSNIGEEIKSYKRELNKRGFWKDGKVGSIRNLFLQLDNITLEESDITVLEL